MLHRNRRRACGHCHVCEPTEGQTPSLRHYTVTVCTLKPWTSPPMPFSEERRKWNLITLSPSCPRSGRRRGIIILKLVSCKTRSVKILWTRAPSSLTRTRRPPTLSSADSDSEALGGMGPEILRFSQALKWSDIASMNHHRGSKRAGGSSLAILSCLWLAASKEVIPIPGSQALVSPYP